MYSARKIAFNSVIALTSPFCGRDHSNIESAQLHLSETEMIEISQHLDPSLCGDSDCEKEKKP